MKPTIFVSEGNRLIDRLSRRDCKSVLQQCRTVDLVVGAVLCEPNEVFEHVYFPLAGFISAVSALGGHPPVQVGLIGNEGMLGVTLALGVREAPIGGSVQGSGRALRMSATELRRQLRSSPSLLSTLNRYLYVQLTQLSRSAACVHFHEVRPRLARWLLMARDRALGDHIRLTHQLMADILGVRRSGITIAAGELQRRQLIRYHRGEITICDRAGLERVSCDCYGEQLRDYARMFD